MYYVVKQTSYSIAGYPSVCAVDLQRRWGSRQEKNKGWKNLMFWGKMAAAIHKVLIPGTIVDISGGGIMRFPKPRKKKGNYYGDQIA